MPTKVEKDHVTGTDTTGHEWDGLKELNTPLPKWWLYMFYACIAFSVVWVIIYPSLPVFGYRGTSGWVARDQIGPILADQRAKQEPMLVRIRAATPAQIVADPELRAFAMVGGRVAFANNCAGCHGAGGQGAPGGFPSLADDSWIWGGSYDAIHKTIAHGIRNTEDPQARASIMPPYGQMLQPAQIGDIAGFVLSLSGEETGADQASLDRGKALFAQNCAACHGPAGKGNQLLGAPDLSDKIWLYGNTRADVIRQITSPRMGVMPAWAGRLDPATINMLTVYVHQLGGGQ